MRSLLPLIGSVLVAAMLSGCRSDRNEALAIVALTVSPDIPSFTMVRFSVEGRPEVRPREVPYDPDHPLRFGYYLPGPSGMVSIRAGALAGAGCLVGEGIADVEVQVGHVSAPVLLNINRIKIVDPGCRPDASDDATPPDRPDDASMDDRPVDAPPVDAGGERPADASPPERPPPDAAPPPPACMTAVQRCPGASACCPGLRCGSTTAGQVCCGDFNAGCTRPGGEDCCGQLECFRGRCCLPPVYFCAGHEGECCEGRTCGVTTAGRVCCGQVGAACTRPGGEDCCGRLECRNGRCG